MAVNCSAILKIIIISLGNSLMDCLRLTHLLGDCKNLGKKCAFTEKIKVFQLCGAVKPPFSE